MKILLADDHILFRAGFQYVLAQLSPEEKICVLEAGSHAEVMQYIDANRDISLLLLDLAMPGENGFVTLREIKQKHLILPVVVLSASENEEDMKKALSYGALGYITKSTPVEVMIQALRLVLAGGIYVPHTLVPCNSEIPREGSPMLQKLSRRQIDVLSRVVIGKPNKLIAAELNLSEATVKAHISAIFRILNITNRSQAANVVNRLGMAEISNNLTHA